MYKVLSGFEILVSLIAQDAFLVSVVVGRLDAFFFRRSLMGIQLTQVELEYH